MRNTIVSAAAALSMLMTSGGYLARSFNAEPVRANVAATGFACNWYSCPRARSKQSDAKRLNKLVADVLRRTTE